MNIRKNFFNLIVFSFVCSALMACASNPKSFEDATTTEDLGYSSSTNNYYSSDADDTYSSGDSYDSQSSDESEIGDSYAAQDSSYSYSDSEEESHVDLSENLPAKEEVAPGYESYDQSPSSYESASSYNQNQIGATTSYTVQRGDTLMKIAFEFYGDYLKWKDIFHANRHLVGTPETMQVGITLTLEDIKDDVQLAKNGDSYRIQPNDTLQSISMELYGTPAKWKTLWQNNQTLIKNPNQIFYGFTLYYVPDANRRQPTNTQYEEPAPAASETQEQEYDSGIYYE